MDERLICWCDHELRDHAELASGSPGGWCMGAVIVGDTWASSTYVGQRTDPGTNASVPAYECRCERFHSVLAGRELENGDYVGSRP